MILLHVLVSRELAVFEMSLEAPIPQANEQNWSKETCLSAIHCTFEKKKRKWVSTQLICECFSIPANSFRYISSFFSTNRLDVELRKLSTEQQTILQASPVHSPAGRRSSVYLVFLHADSSHALVVPGKDQTIIDEMQKVVICLCVESLELIVSHFGGCACQFEKRLAGCPMQKYSVVIYKLYLSVLVFCDL